MPPSSPPSTVPKARNYSGVSAEERTTTRRARLIEAAKDVFGQRGYAQATMRDICARSRLAERYFYESFSSTKDLFEAVYRQEVRAMMAAIHAAINAAPLNSAGLAREGVRAFLTFIKDDPRRVQIILIDGVWMDQMKVRKGESDLVTYSEVIRTMAQVFYPGLSPEINVELAASGLVAMAIHTAIAWARTDFAADIGTVLSHNMYAWGGIRHWIKSTALGVGVVRTENEKRTRIRTAFKIDDEVDGPNA